MRAVDWVTYHFPFYDPALMQLCREANVSREAGPDLPLPPYEFTLLGTYPADGALVGLDLGGLSNHQFIMNLFGELAEAIGYQYELQDYLYFECWEASRYHGTTQTYTAPAALRPQFWLSEVEDIRRAIENFSIDVVKIWELVAERTGSFSPNIEYPLPTKTTSYGGITPASGNHYINKNTDTANRSFQTPLSDPNFQHEENVSNSKVVGPSWTWGFRQWFEVGPFTKPIQSWQRLWFNEGIFYYESYQNSQLPNWVNQWYGWFKTNAIAANYDVVETTFNFATWQEMHQGMVRNSLAYYDAKLEWTVTIFTPLNDVEADYSMTFSGINGGGGATVNDNTGSGSRDLSTGSNTLPETGTLLMPFSLSGSIVGVDDIPDLLATYTGSLSIHIDFDYRYTRTSCPADGTPYIKEV